MSTEKQDQNEGVPVAKPTVPCSAVSLPLVGDAAAPGSAVTHRQLVEAAYRWVLNNGSCGFAFRELVTMNTEIPDVIGFRSGSHSVLVECKASRADFLADRKKRHRRGEGAYRPMGMFRFYATLKGMIRVDELPERWGLLELNKRGVLYQVHNHYNPAGGNTWRGGFQDHNIGGEARMMYSALRRLHLRGRIEEIYQPPRVSDRSGTPQASNPAEEYSVERVPQGDAQTLNH